jgi:hypothetical protein
MFSPQSVARKAQSGCGGFRVAIYLKYPSIEGTRMHGGPVQRLDRESSANPLTIRHY